MNSNPSIFLADFELLALRSDGFYEVKRRSDGEHLLLQKIVPAGGMSEAARLGFQRAMNRIAGFRGAGALAAVTAFEDEGAFFAGFPYFEGRTLAVQILRGRRFTFGEAWGIALWIARILRGQKKAHGAIVPANVLLDEREEIRLVPEIHDDPAPRPEPAVESDIRQLALLVGYLVIGEASGPAFGEVRAVSAWTMRQEVPVQYRAVLGHMLAASPSCQTWKSCLREMERASRGPVAVKTKRHAGAALAWAAVITAICGAWVWHRFYVPVPPPAVVASAPVKSVPAATAATPQASPMPEVRPMPEAKAEPPPASPASTVARETAQQIPQPLPPQQPPQALPDAPFPGLPRLTLSLATPVGDPDARQLVRATQWVVEHGDWGKYRDQLDQALVSTAALGNWTRYPDNLESILTLPTPSLMLSQDAVLHAIDPSVFEHLPKDRETADFLTWLFTNPRAAALLAQTVKPEDNAQRVLEIWRDCRANDPEGAEKYMALALAVAVVFDQDISITPGYFGTKATSSYTYTRVSPESRHTIDPVDRYRFYREADARGALKTVLANLKPYELVWVVDAPVPDDELIWAQKNVSYTQRDWGQAYSSIRYRMDKATGGTQIYDRYTLAQIKERGGICEDQAYYASVTAKANGIPAMTITGEGDRGAHAWVQWEASPEGWSEAGRYADNYAAGTTSDPQTHRTIKEQELREFTAPERRSEGWVKTESYLRFSRLLASAGKPEIAQIALDAAVQATPQSQEAWNALLDGLVAAKASTEDWEKEIARMRVEFQKFPDVIQEINRRETDYLAANGDAKDAMDAVQRQGHRFVREDKSRTDLILDSIFQQADMAAKAGDSERAGKIYRDALRENGTQAVPFKSISERYYAWAQPQSEGAKAVHEIETAFRRNFRPDGDYFELTAYCGTLNAIADLYKKEGLDEDAHRLGELSDRVQKQIEKLKQQAQRNAPTQRDASN